MKTTKNKTKSGERKKYSSAFARELLTGLDQLHHAVATGDYSKVTVRRVEIVKPGHYGAREVQALRKRLGVSQPVFASLVGVSAVLVAHWEHGIREPSALARRLFDKIKENPTAYRQSLVRRQSA